MKTIPRNCNDRRYQNIWASVTKARRYDLESGFLGVDTTPEAAKTALWRFEFARLKDMGNGSFQVWVHGNLWYELA